MIFRNPAIIKGTAIADVVSELFDLKGTYVVDAGCGDGKLVRAMAAKGAHVFGIEPNQNQVKQARGYKLVDDEFYSVGSAEAIPANDLSIDLVVFSNSLHHVPDGLRAAALREAARVMKRDGYLMVAEPTPYGAHKELMLPVQDETQVQAHAYEAILDQSGHGLIAVREDIFNRESLYSSYEHFREAMIDVDARRENSFRNHDKHLRHLFSTLGQAAKFDGTEGRNFDQEIRINVLCKYKHTPHNKIFN